MKIAVLGTGVVGQTIAGKLISLDHDVVIGTRDVNALMDRNEASRATPFADWLAQHPPASVAHFAEAASHGEIVFSATAGLAALDALHAAGAASLAGKVLIDISNPLDFSAGMPPTLSVSNTDSLGEQIQRAFPDATVVKTLNTVNASVMVDPAAVDSGDHHIFMSGNDTSAKQRVEQILTEWFGWANVIDLGDITTARATEMYLALWIRIMGALGTPAFNIKIAR